MRVLARVIFLTVLCGPPATWAATAPASFGTRELLAAAGQVTSIEELIPLLPEEMRRNVLLMYKSRSGQGASDTFPRVILHSNDARFTLAFTGDPNAPGGQTLEFFEFNDATNAFEFRELDFDPQGRRPPIDSGINPPRCYACHARGGGPNPFKLRPNWDGYHVWRGAYGSNDDNFEDRMGHNASTRPVADEKEGLRKFRETAQGHGRFASLLGLEDNFPVDGLQRPDGSMRPLKRPNLKYTEAASKLNARRVAAAMRASPHYEAFKPVLVDLLSNDSSLHPDVRPLSPYNERTMHVMADYQRAAGRELFGSGDPIAFSSMSFRPEGVTERMQFNDGYARFHRLLAEDLTRNDPDYAALVALRGSDRASFARRLDALVAPLQAAIQLHSCGPGLGELTK
jgi:hypothetical protein